MPLSPNNNNNLAISTTFDVALASAIVWATARFVHPKLAMIVALWALIIYALDLVDYYYAAREHGWQAAHVKVVMCIGIQGVAFLVVVWIVVWRERMRA